MIQKDDGAGKEESGGEAGEKETGEWTVFKIDLDLIALNENVTVYLYEKCLK